MSSKRTVPIKTPRARSTAHMLGAAAAGLLLGVALVVGVAGAAKEAQEPTADSQDPRDKIEALTVTEKEELRRKTEQFERLSDEEKNRLRSLHDELTASPDHERLEHVMLHYNNWLATLSGQERADLLKLPAGERLEEIKRLTAQQRAQRFREAVGTPLEPADVRVILAWLDNYVEQHEAELLATISEPIRSRVQQVQSAEIRRKMLLMSLGRRTIGVDLPAPKDEDLRKLISGLSQKTQETLKLAPQREQKIKLLQEWVRAAVWSRGLPQVSDETLLRFYREHRQRFDRQRQEELDSLPPEMFYQEMRKYYLQSRMFGRPHRDGEGGGPPWLPDGKPPWGEGPPGGFPPPDGRDRRPGEHGGGDRPLGERGPGDRRGDGLGGRRFGNPPRDDAAPPTGPSDAPLEP
ncbi:MAG: DUF2613 family protein [Planctomycetales bacterium]|nr:DUF2613 family protein [Planctomycetales bacterium]